MSSKFSTIAGMSLCVILTACGGELFDKERKDNPNSEAPDVTTPSAIPTAVPTNAPSPAEPEPQPDPEQQPDPEPTAVPTPLPSSEPVASPTAEPTPDIAPSPAPDQNPSYSVLVQWDIPTTRENGSDLLLSDIAGYDIYYKKVGETELLKKSVDIATTSEATLANLSAGLYEFYITTLDTDGLRSQNSPLLSAQIGN